MTNPCDVCGTGLSAHWRFCPECGEHNILFWREPQKQWIGRREAFPPEESRQLDKPEIARAKDRLRIGGPGSHAGKVLLDLKTILGACEKNGTLAALPTVAIYFNEHELRAIIAALEI